PRVRAGSRCSISTTRCVPAAAPTRRYGRTARTTATTARTSSANSWRTRCAKPPRNAHSQRADSRAVFVARRVGLALLVVAVTAVAGCGGATRAATVAKSKPRPERIAPTTTAPTTTVPVRSSITEIPSPPEADGEAFRWYEHPAGDGPHVVLAVRRTGDLRPHPAVLLADTSGGFNLDYLVFADELVGRGFDVVVGCLYTAPEPLDPESGRIPCADAPL